MEQGLVVVWRKLRGARPDTQGKRIRIPLEVSDDPDRDAELVIAASRIDRFVDSIRRAQKELLFEEHRRRAAKLRSLEEEDTNDSTS